MWAVNRNLVLFALQFMRHAVVVIVDFDVVVDADGGDLPLGVFVSFVCQPVFREAIFGGKRGKRTRRAKWRCIW